MDDDERSPGKVLLMARMKPVSVIDQILSPVARVVAPPPPAAAKPTPVEPGPPLAELDYLPPPKKADPLPRPGDAYRACAQYMNRLGTGERMLDIVDKDCYSEGFSYSDLRRVSWRKAKTPGSGPLLVLRFIEASVIEVLISGRNLEDIRHYLREGMLPWIWEQPTGYKARHDQMPVITGIEFHELEE